MVFSLAQAQPRQSQAVVPTAMAKQAGQLKLTQRAPTLTGAHYQSTKNQSPTPS
jgi:hypothetical protein